MALPIAKITLENGATPRGLFLTRQDLRAVSSHGDGDVAQLHDFRRVYSFDPGSMAVDDGLDPNVVKPDDILVSNPGRWLSGDISIDLTLEGTTSAPSDQGSSITSYAWFLVFEPSEGSPPAAALVAGGATAVLTIPLGAGWNPGGILVFLRVTDNAGQTSIGNPYAPALNPDALFQYILGTEELGFEIPAAGSRNWHRHYQRAFILLDAKIKEVAETIPGANFPVKEDKGKNPTNTTTMDQEAVANVFITKTPAGDGVVAVYVGGLRVQVGNGVKTEDCYFSPDGGTTARLFADIQAGDQLIWNTVIAGYGVSPSDDIDFDYDAA